MLLTDLRIYTAAGEPIENGFLKIENGKIKALGPMNEVPQGTGISCKGKTAYPGFVDAHCHLGMWEDSLGFEGDDGNESTDPSTPQLRALDAVNVLDRGFSEAVAAGVTSVLTGPGSGNPISGQFCALKTCGRCIDDMAIKVFAAMKFAFGENPKAIYHEREEAPLTRMATAAIIREQLYKARRYQEDCLQAQEDEEDELPDYDIKCEALLPVLAGEVHAQMHAHRADDIFTALRLASEFSIRPVIVHGTQGHEVADILAARGAAVITGPLWGTRSKPELKSLSPNNPGVLHRAGVRVAICTDHPEAPISMLALSAGLACQNGMDYDAAISAITIEAARLGEIDSRVGSLQVGKDADILLYSCDPLLLGSRPDAVLIDGEVRHGEL